MSLFEPIFAALENSAIRSLLISGWNAQALELGFGIAAAIAFVAMIAASGALKGRLART